MEQFTIGVDLGGTTITAGLVDKDYKIIHKITCDTNLPRPEAEVEQTIADLCRQTAKEAGVDWQQICWVGIGTPGSANSEDGVVDFNANFGYVNWQLAADMEALLNCKVYIENDANAAAYGEYLAGGAKGARYAMMITLGTGIGGGFIMDGQIYSGFNFAGAEFGHMAIVKDGRPCMCGRKGCWEKYASSRALTEDTREALKAHPDNMMWQLAKGELANVNAKTAFDGMRAGDPLATELVRNFVDYIGCGLTNLINIFQPEVVCIGGGVSKEGETLLAPIREYVDKNDYARMGVKRVHIKAAQLRNDAGVVGAACLGNQKNKL